MIVNASLHISAVVNNNSMLVFTGCSSISLLDVVLMQMTTKFICSPFPIHHIEPHIDIV